MPSKKEDNKIDEKLEYLGLNLSRIPKALKDFEELEYKVPKFYDESQYKQYRFVNVKDIQILLTPANRLDELEEKYKNASPLSDYLDSKSEENAEKNAVFLNMLKNVQVEKIEEIEKEQEKLAKTLPFKVKFASNYKWQIYYSKNTDKYFMLVPTEETENEPFFYLLKKKIENKKNSVVFVPISGIDYTSQYLKKSEIQNMENYMWLFTKSWPLIYEVYDKDGNLSIQIIGETFVYEKVKSWYKIKLESQEQASDFYKLIKAMFILQTELQSYFNFITGINKEGIIEFYRKDTLLDYEELPNWIKNEYIKCNESKGYTSALIKENEEKLNKYKEEAVLLERDFLEKEKQITTFLECKKTFFGKVKYFFKFGKSKKDKNKDKKIEEIVEEEETIKNDDISINESNEEKDNYTIEELIQNYKELEAKENELKNIKLDINALKLKNKNLTKKIENASIFIKEIDSHKKSIFEFWKYSNKDAVDALPEGEVEEVNVVRKIERSFDYEEDLENLGKKYDKLIRKNLSQDETDAVFITSTDVIEVLNKIKTNEILPKELDNNLKQLKKEAIDESDNEDYELFGASEDNTKVGVIKNKKHREIEKDKFNILEINKNTKQLGYKLVLEQILNKIKSALDKVKFDEEIPVYKLVEDEFDKDLLNVFNINPINEMQKCINSKANEFVLYKINLKKEVNGVPFTNIIFYNNQNQTLPVGMDISTRALIDLSGEKLENEVKNTFNILNFENEEDEFDKYEIKTINVIEADV